jgi:cell wall-associated NlpC family hydrolase
MAAPLLITGLARAGIRLVGVAPRTALGLGRVTRALTSRRKDPRRRSPLWSRRRRRRRRRRIVVLALLLLMFLPPLVGGNGIADMAQQEQQMMSMLLAQCGDGGGSDGGGVPADMDLERVLAALRKVESSSYEGNYTLVNRWGAGGAYQFLPGTWVGDGGGDHRGYERAENAPKEVQDARAREHVQELLDQLDGPWDRVVALGWYLGPGPDGAPPFMHMPDSDPRWDQPRDGFGTTPRQYLQRFRDYYANAPAGSVSVSETAGLCRPGGDVPTTAERQAMLERARTWLTAVNGGPVAYCMCTDPSTYHDGWRADCSGFVSFVWQLDQPGADTVALQRHAEPIARDELQPGDIMLRPLPGGEGHVALFERWDENDPDYMWIIHQTPPRTTHERVRYDGYVARGFSPYRKTGVD